MHGSGVRDGRNARDLHFDYCYFISIGIIAKAKSRYPFDGYAHLSSGLPAT